MNKSHSMKKTLILGISLMVSVGIISISSTLAWTGPTASPPERNVAFPINTSNVAQEKQGRLDLRGGLNMRGTKIEGITRIDEGIYYLDPNGTSNLNSMNIVSDTYIGGDLDVVGGFTSGSINSGEVSFGYGTVNAVDINNPNSLVNKAYIDERLANLQVGDPSTPINNKLVYMRFGDNMDIVDEFELSDNEPWKEIIKNESNDGKTYRITKIDGSVWTLSDSNENDFPNRTLELTSPADNTVIWNRASNIKIKNGELQRCNNQRCLAPTKLDDPNNNNFKEFYGVNTSGIGFENGVGIKNDGTIWFKYQNHEITQMGSESDWKSITYVRTGLGSNVFSPTSIAFALKEDGVLFKITTDDYVWPDIEYDFTQINYTGGISKFMRGTFISNSLKGIYYWPGSVDPGFKEFQGSSNVKVADLEGMPYIYVRNDGSLWYAGSSSGPDTNLNPGSKYEDAVIVGGDNNNGGFRGILAIKKK